VSCFAVAALVVSSSTIFVLKLKSFGWLVHLPEARLVAFRVRWSCLVLVLGMVPMAGAHSHSRESCSACQWSGALRSRARKVGTFFGGEGGCHSGCDALGFDVGRTPGGEFHGVTSPPLSFFFEMVV
jgi:hypothetical protein